MSGKKSNTKTKLLDAAVKSIAKHGYDGMVLENIARTVGIRSATIFYHFPDGKEQIYNEVFIRIYQSFSTLLESGIQKDLSAPQVLVDLCNSFWLYCQNNCDYVQILYREWIDSNTSGIRELNTAIYPVVEGARAYIEKEQTTGNLAKFNIDYFMYSLSSQIFSFYAVPGMRRSLWTSFSEEELAEEVSPHLIDYINKVCKP